MSGQTTDSSRKTYPQAIFGYRAWIVSEDRLWPLHIDGPPWCLGVNMAVCVGGDHQAPAGDCHCGFNAHHDLDGAIGEAINWRWRLAPHLMERKAVIGVIAGSGNVEVHRDGFRCRQAQVLGLIPISAIMYKNRNGNVIAGGMASPAEIEAVGAAYQVPVYHSREELYAAVRRLIAYGQLSRVPDRLLPADLATQAKEAYPEPSQREIWKETLLRQRTSLVWLAAGLASYALLIAASSLPLLQLLLLAAEICCLAFAFKSSDS